MIAGDQMKGMAQVGDLFPETLGRPFVEIREGRHRVDHVAEMDDERQFAPVEVANHVPQASVGPFVDLELRIAVSLAEVHMGIRHHGISEEMLPKIPWHQDSFA
jgi:hypothetical protein